MYIYSQFMMHGQKNIKLHLVGHLKKYLSNDARYHEREVSLKFDNNIWHFGAWGSVVVKALRY